MRTRPLLFALGVALAFAARAENSEPVRASLSLKNLPPLNSRLAALPDTRVLELANSGTLAPSFAAEVGGVPWIVSVEKETGRVLMVRTTSPTFQTPEHVSVGTQIASLAAKYPGKVLQELGWGDWIELPSGFCAFLHFPGETASATSTVKFIFRRCR